MMKILCWLLVFPFLCGNAQTLQHIDTLAGTEVIIHTEIQDSLLNFAFVHVHANETSALNSVKQFLQPHNGNLFYLQHAGERNISFRFHDTVFEFDPNRIFTDKGRRATLSPYLHAADSIVKHFAEDFLLQLNGFETIIALHNNTASNYSVKSYCKGGIFEKEALKIYISKAMDEDDFIFTTDEDIFNRCKKKKLNVVLQDNKQCTDDGSLSVYCANTNISYINIEAQNGHEQQQLRMLKFACQIIHP